MSQKQRNNYDGESKGKEFCLESEFEHKNSTHCIFATKEKLGDDIAAAGMVVAPGVALL